jgi:cold shock protein
MLPQVGMICFPRRGAAVFCPALFAFASQGTHRMPTGIVKFYNVAKGYGFIQPDDGSTDIFVHVSALERAGMRDLTEGQKITFDVQADPRSGKSRAVNLREE